MKLHTRSPLWVMAVTAATITALIPLWQRWAPRLVINGTPSEPLGIYWLVFP